MQAPDSYVLAGSENSLVSEGTEIPLNQVTTEGEYQNAGKEPITITVDSNTAFQVEEETGKFIVVVEQFNDEAVGSLTLNKTGEKLTGAEKIEDRLQNEHKNVESRSEWLLQLLDEKEKKTDRKGLCLAECIVNLCYNYAVEYSICDVSKHYEVASLSEPGNDSFHDDFFSRLKIEWENESNDEHRFLKEENNSLRGSSKPKVLPIGRWRFAFLGKKEKIDEGIRVMILCQNPQPLAGLVKNGYMIDHVTIGNMASKPGAEHVADNAYVSKEEREAFTYLAQQGIPIYYQIAPNKPAEEITNKFK